MGPRYVGFSLEMLEAVVEQAPSTWPTGHSTETSS
ncbi:hypothetical protein HNR29_001650 [Rhizobium leguminosarum]|nr:hypothetical protein [Rhizobium leguminosarum]